MRHLFPLVLIAFLAGAVSAANLSNFQNSTQQKHPTELNPGTPDGREGGEDMATAIVIIAIPFTDTGNTSDNIDDYDAMCPYGGSLSPDVVYSYTPSLDEVISLDLCGSGYDTKISVLDGGMNIIACNDDYYFDDVCGVYVSFIEGAYLTGGIEYFIVVDGYGNQAGDYILNVLSLEISPACEIVCEGVPENEPALGPDYDDAHNSGCGGSMFGNPFQSLMADPDGELVFCGSSGWYSYGASDFRDTDWFTAFVGASGQIEWTVDAEQPTLGYLLGPNDCEEVAPVQTMTAGACAPATMTIAGTPGEMIWLWIGPTEFSAPVGFEGYEYNYISSFTGLFSGTVATDQVSFDRIKSLYR